MRFVTLSVAVLSAALLICGCGGGGGRRGGGGGERNAPRGERWEKLGSRMVDFRGDRDEILANFQGDFVALRFDVDRADVEMWDVKVHFGNGQVWSPGTRLNFGEGSRSRRIDLPGNVRHIQKVVFFYKTAHRGEGRANIDLYGLHPN